VRTTTLPKELEMSSDSTLGELSMAESCCVWPVASTAIQLAWPYELCGGELMSCEKEHR
jgi:hypothetical protein